jgi:hypothetical protein
VWPSTDEFGCHFGPNPPLFPTLGRSDTDLAQLDAHDFPLLVVLPFKIKTCNALEFILHRLPFAIIAAPANHIFRIMLGPRYVGRDLCAGRHRHTDDERLFFFVFEFLFRHEFLPYFSADEFVSSETGTVPSGSVESPPVLPPIGFTGRPSRQPSKPIKAASTSAVASLLNPPSLGFFSIRSPPSNVKKIK